MGIEVKLYGKETQPFQYLKHLIFSIQKRYPNQFHVAEINDLDSIISDGIEYIPSISINGDIIAYNPTENQAMESFAKKAISQLLTETNYGEMQKILVPTDFSDCSINAFIYAKSMANAIEHMIELVHFDHPTPVGIDGAMVAAYFEEDEKRKKLNALTEPLTDDIGKEFFSTPLKTSYIQGLACDNLVEMSKDADLIVMGTHGKGNLITQLLGSVSRYSIRKACCPVLLIPSEYDYQVINKIVFGYAPSIHDSDYINQVVAWTQKLNAHLDIVHVVKKIEDTDPTMGIQQYIDLKFPDLSYSCRSVESNDVEKGLLQVAHEQNADLIILAKQEKSLWQYLTTEHHSTDILELTDRPIMIIHQEVKKCKCGGMCKKKPADRCDH